MTKKKDLSDTVALYQELLGGRRKRMPRYTWSPMHGGHDNFRKVLRYVVLEKLKWEKSELLRHISFEWFEQHRLHKGLEYTFQDFYSCITACFAEWELKEWELPIASGYDTATPEQWLRWFILTKMGWETRDIIVNKFNGNMLRKYGSYKIYSAFKGVRIFEALCRAFPEYDFQPDEFRWGRRNDR